MGRTNALALRLRGLVNWRSSVRHPLLSAYVRHIFQDHLVGEPGIRASTAGVWINVTVLPIGSRKHPFLPTSPEARAQPLAPFASVSVRSLLGRDERRIFGVAAKNPYHARLFKGYEKTTLEHLPVDATGTATFASAVTANTKTSEDDSSESVQDARLANCDFASTSPLLELGTRDPLAALQIYRDTPIHLRVNKISNPLLDAGILASYVCRDLEKNRQLARIFKALLQKLSK